MKIQRFDANGNEIIDITDPSIIYDEPIYTLDTIETQDVEIITGHTGRTFVSDGALTAKDVYERWSALAEPIQSVVTAPTSRLVWCNTLPLPQPSEYNATSATLVDEARNMNGVLVGGVVRHNVSKIELIWKFLTPKEWAFICQMPFISSIQFYDQDVAGWSVKNMYKSDRTASLFRMSRLTGNPRGFKDCRIALIEV